MHSLFADSLNKDEIEYLEEHTVFDRNEIQYLFERFTYLDRNKSGYLTYTDFEMIPEFSSNPFKSFILSYLEDNIAEYEHINFAYFLDFLKIFHRKTPKSSRVNFLFTIFDLNKDHKLCKDVLFKIQKMLGLKEDASAVNDVLSAYDIGQKGFLDIIDFTRFYDEDGYFEHLMVVDLSKNIPKRERRATIWDILWNTENE